MNKSLYLDNLRQVLMMDLAMDRVFEDVTSALLPEKSVKSSIISREDGVFCGIDAVYIAAELVGIEVEFALADADPFEKDQKIVVLSGDLRKILSLERTLINILQTTSGTATFVRKMVNILKNTGLELLDTRKTLPAMRYIQKYAVKIGGAQNHRLNLNDSYMIKDNHIANMSIVALLEAIIAKNDGKSIIIEVDDLDQLAIVLDFVKNHKINQYLRVMLDNFTYEDMQKAVLLNAKTLPIEVSGVVCSEQSLSYLAKIGVDFVSIGALTKNIKAIDFSMEF